MSLPDDKYSCRGESDFEKERSFESKKRGSRTALSSELVLSAFTVDSGINPRLRGVDLKIRSNREAEKRDCFDPPFSPMIFVLVAHWMYAERFVFNSDRF